MTLDLNQLYCGDAFELLRKVEDESVDLIICDGPYGVTQNEWDRIPPIQEFNLELIKRFDMARDVYQKIVALVVKASELARTVGIHNG